MQHFAGVKVVREVAYFFECRLAAVGLHQEVVDLVQCVVDHQPWIQHRRYHNAQDPHESSGADNRVSADTFIPSVNIGVSIHCASAGANMFFRIQNDCKKHTVHLLDIGLGLQERPPIAAIFANQSANHSSNKHDGAALENKHKDVDSTKTHMSLGASHLVFLLKV